MKFSNARAWIATALLSVATLASADAVISVGPATNTIGSTYEVPILISGAPDGTFSWQFDLAYDPSYLVLNSVVEGTFFSSFVTTLDPGTLFSPGVIDNNNGLVSLVTDSFIDFGPMPFGDGLLAVLTFEALVPVTSTNLDLSNASLNLQEVAVRSGSLCVPGFGEGGAVVCNVASVPEPSALALITLGLVAFGLCRRLSRPSHPACKLAAAQTA